MFPSRNFLSRGDSFVLLGLVFALFLLSCLCLVVLGTSEACGFDFCILLVWWVWMIRGVWGAIRQVSYDFGVLGGNFCFRVFVLMVLAWFCFCLFRLKFANFAVR